MFICLFLMNYSFEVTYNIIYVYVSIITLKDKSLTVPVVPICCYCFVIVYSSGPGIRNRIFDCEIELHKHVGHKSVDHWIRTRGRKHKQQLI